MNLPNDFKRINDRHDAQQYYVAGRSLTTEEIIQLNKAGITFTITPDIDFNFHYLGTIVTVFTDKTDIEAGSSYLFTLNSLKTRWSRKR